MTAALGAATAALPHCIWGPEDVRLRNIHHPLKMCGRADGDGENVLWKIIKGKKSERVANMKTPGVKFHILYIFLFLFHFSSFVLAFSF